MRERAEPAEGRLSCLEVATKLVWLSRRLFALSAGHWRMSVWGRERVMNESRTPVMRQARRGASVARVAAAMGWASSCTG